MELYKKIDEYIGRIAPIAFIILTFIICIDRVPFFDEALSYLISRLSLSEIFQITRAEGHTVIWYLIIKPFNNLDWYPYPMILINWLFVMCAMMIFWKKAPFNNIIKMLISFSFPIFQYYAIAARPYGMAVLLLVLLTTFYKQSDKKPVLYAFLLALCANTSVIACISTVGFGLVYLYDIFSLKIKLTKKQIFIILSIFLIGLLGLIFQFVNLELAPTVSNEMKNGNMFRYFSYFLINPFFDFKHKLPIRFILELTSFIMLYYTPFVLVSKDRRALAIVLIPTLIFVYFIINIYPCAYWHYYFIFILLICSFWLCWDKIKTVKPLHFLFIVLILSNMSGYAVSFDGKGSLSESFIYRKNIEVILKNDELKNGKLFCFDKHTIVAQGILPYLLKHNITTYDNHNNDRTKFDSLKNFQKLDYRYFKPDEFVNYLDKSRGNYLLAKTNRITDYQDFSIKGKDYIIYFNLAFKHPEMYLAVFKITAKKIK